jgi:hypothetical protein
MALGPLALGDCRALDCSAGSHRPMAGHGRAGSIRSCRGFAGEIVKIRKLFGLDHCFGHQLPLAAPVFAIAVSSPHDREIANNRCIRTPARREAISAGQCRRSVRRLASRPTTRPSAMTTMPYPYVSSSSEATDDEIIIRVMSAAHAILRVIQDRHESCKQGPIGWEDARPNRALRLALTWRNAVRLRRFENQGGRPH